MTEAEALRALFAALGRRWKVLRSRLGIRLLYPPVDGELIPLENGGLLCACGSTDWGRMVYDDRYFCYFCHREVDGTFVVRNRLSHKAMVA